MAGDASNLAVYQVDVRIQACTGAVFQRFAGHVLVVVHADGMIDCLKAADL